MGSLTTVKYDFSLLLNTAMREKLKLLHYQEHRWLCITKNNILQSFTRALGAY